MKPRHVVLALALIALGWSWTRHASRSRSMSYHLGFARCADGIVSVEAVLTAPGGGPGAAPGAPLVLGALLADGTFGMTNLHAFDATGAELPVRFESASAPGDSKAPKRFTRIVVEPRASRAVRLTYEIEPGVYLPPSGDKELRRCGSVSARGCALSLTNLLLLPEGAATILHLRAELPTGWRTLVPLPTAVSSADRESLRRGALVAGEYDRTGALVLASGVRAHVGTGCSDELVAAVGETLRAIEDTLGPPRGPLELFVLPALDGGAPVELPATSPVLALDLRGPDPASLRRLVQHLIPAWWGRRRVDLELASDPRAWFAVGLGEYLSYVLPSRAGLVARDPVLAIESSWISQPELRGIDLRAPTDGTRPSQYARRLVSAALLHDLDRGLPQGLGVHLRGFDGRGFPSSLSHGPEAATFGAWLAARIDAGQRQLFFEPDWDLRWDPEPIRSADSGSVARVLRLAFTAGTEGTLETCGCKAGQAGGVARRATALREWRRDDPELVLIDLGDFSALRPGEARVDPTLAEEQGLYPELMDLLGYDAVVLGPDELYSGFVEGPGAEIRGAVAGVPRAAAWSPGRAAWLGGGIEVAGEPLGPRFTIVEREGLRIGVVGHTELLENAHARQAQEVHMAAVRFPESPDTALLRELRGRVDLLVVAGRMRPATLRALADPDLGVDLVLSANHPVAIEAGASGFLGRTAVAFDRMGFIGLQRLDLFLSAEGRVLSATCSARRLDTEVPEDEVVRARLDRFYSSSVVANLPVEPLFGEDPWHQGDYVGSQACAACHVEQHRTWRATRHATAMATLGKKRRDRNPACVKCHVVGLGSATGYSIARPDPDLGAVGCENCHGAGRGHAERPSRDNIRLTPEPSTCVRCHDAKHSDSFEERFEEAWARVLHR